MSYLLIGLSVPLSCLALLLGMARYETWMLEARPDRPSRGFARAALVAALVAGVSESVDLADDRASLGLIAHVGLALAAGAGALLARRHSWLAAIVFPVSLVLPLAAIAIIWQGTLEGFSASDVLRAAGTQLPAVAVGLPGALLAAGGILMLRSRLAPA